MKYRAICPFCSYRLPRHRVFFDAGNRFNCPNCNAILQHKSDKLGSVVDSLPVLLILILVHLGILHWAFILIAVALTLIYLYIFYPYLKYYALINEPIVNPNEHTTDNHTHMPPIPQPPDNSIIHGFDNSGLPQYSWSNESSRTRPEGTLLLILFILFAFPIGIWLAIQDIWIVSIVWLLVWIYLFVICIRLLYLIFRKTKPAMLLFTRDRILYETGTIRPNKIKLVPNAEWLNKIHSIPRQELNNLRLEQNDEEKEIVIEITNQRISIGRYLSDFEKRWLYFW